MTRYLLAWMLVVPSVMCAQAGGRASEAKSSGKPSAPAAAEETWDIDTSHSELSFNLRLFTGRSEGRFRTWSGTITMPPGRWEDAVVDVVIQAASVDTDNDDRDKHLRNEDFFDVEKYPVLTFKSTKVTRDGDSLAIAGNLTIKDVTKRVVLKGKYAGGASRATPTMKFEATVTINRLEYGVNYENIFVRDKIVLGEDVTVDIRLVAVRR